MTPTKQQMKHDEAACRLLEEPRPLIRDETVREAGNANCKSSVPTSRRSD